jgi:C-terminal processing protease CtpA/Prc
MLDTTTQTEIIQNLKEKVKADYVFPEVAEEICKRLENWETEAEIEDEAFAEALTAEMQDVSSDKHLVVRWQEDPLPEHEGSMLQNEEFNAEMRQFARQDNYGIHKVERMAGNVGYLQINHFVRASWGSGETVTAAMNFLANVDALIVDLRKCSGGNPHMVAQISSYFFDGEPVHLNSLYWREEDVTEQYWTVAHVPGKRMADTALYILTSGETFSAGEEFSYNLQALKRATLVGEATAGGAHPGSPYRLHPHFEVFIPNGRAINPVTKDNWEGVGVQPDVPATAAEALDTAYKLALEGVIKKLGQPESTPFRRQLAQAKTALRAFDSK